MQVPRTYVTGRSGIGLVTYANASDNDDRNNIYVPTGLHCKLTPELWLCPALYCSGVST